MPQRWVVISLDGLATAAMGAYGSSWNETPTIDSMASQGMLWDRCVAPSDDVIEVLRQLWRGISDSGVEGSNLALTQRAELFTETGTAAAKIVQLAEEAGFAQCTLVETGVEIAEVDDSSSEAGWPQEIEETAFARLLLPMIERIGDRQSEPVWSLLWVHSDWLTRIWDAPRWLFPVADDEEETAPDDLRDWSIDDFGDAAEESMLSEANMKPPALFEGINVPRFARSQADHPDLVTSWMQTYGCQIRLVDQLLGWILSATEAAGDSIGVALVGTSGFSLGQNGWIGHHIGPIRSPQIQVPVIAMDRAGPGLRIRRLASVENAASFLHAGPPQRGQRMLPEIWSVDTAPEPIITRSGRADHVVTTDQWYLVQSSDDVSLFLKPDDRDDVNDIADRCRDVVEMLCQQS